MEEEVFIVTSGDYSDYGIDAVFLTKDLAQRFIDSFDENQYTRFRIENHKLNPFKIELRKGYSAFFVRMDKQGNCKESYKYDTSFGFNSDKSYGFDIRDNIYNHVFAKDSIHAIKITNEKRAELIALDKWGI